MNKYILILILIFPANIRSETFKEWLEKDKVKREECREKRKQNFHDFWENLRKKREERMKHKKKMEQVLNVFETGDKDPDYCNITIYNDGPNDRRQITYGRTQVTEFGHLKSVVKNYSERNGLYSEALKVYVDKIGSSSLCNDNNFIKLLKMAGNDPIMMQCQDEVFEAKYWGPAKKWWEENGFKEELSMLVIYDSFVHSGGILPFLRERFKEKVPKEDGNEKEWIKQYVDTRHSWLAGHRRSILQKTIYRTRVFKDLIKEDNWDLGKGFSAQGFSFIGEAPEMITLPKEENAAKYYSQDIEWFSFPCEMILTDGRQLGSLVGDARPDYAANRKISSRLENCFVELFKKLGAERFKKEGWNIFGGSYDVKTNPLGIEVFINPLNESLLSSEGIEIFEKYGFLNMGRATGKNFCKFAAYIPQLSKDSFYSKNGLPKNILQE